MARRFALTGSNLSLDAIRRLMAPDPPEPVMPATARRRVVKAAKFVQELGKRSLPVGVLDSR